MKEIFIICGPTSSGKTLLALNLAKKVDAEIISADSRQIYKFMDIGTGKLPINSSHHIVRNDSCWQINGINVWAYDLATPDQIFSAYDFAQFALEKARELVNNDKRIIIVGGTGFYIDVLTGRMQISDVKPDQELRNSLENETIEKLSAILTSLNPQIASLTDKNNKPRLIRAIERESSKNRNTTPLLPLVDVKYKFVGLTAERSELYQRVDNWLENIWQNGLMDEIQNLIKLGYENSPKLQGLVYKSALDFIKSKLDELLAKERAKFDLHAYIRRQQTWFKRNQDITWFNSLEPNLEEKVYSHLLD